MEKHYNYIDWVLVRFKPDKSIPWCSKIINYDTFVLFWPNFIEKNKSPLEGTFLKIKISWDYTKTWYMDSLMSEIPYICEFNSFQPVGKLEKPVPLGKGLFKFNFDCKSIS